MLVSDKNWIKKVRYLVCIAAFSLLVVPSLAWAQPGGAGGAGGRGGFGRGGFGGWGGGNGTDIMLLLNDEIRSEIDLVDDQAEKLRALMDKQREEMRTMFQGIQGNPGANETDEQRQARFNEMREKMQQRMTELQKDIDGILLPHQSKRIKQISRQMRLRNPQTGINNDQLAEELKLTDEQKEKLKAKAEEVQKKLAEKISKVRKDAEDDILSVLTVEQRAEFKEMVGEPFDTQRIFARQMGFGGPGGPGGPGGAGGPGAPGGRVGRGNPNN